MESLLHCFMCPTSTQGPADGVAAPLFCHQPLCRAGSRSFISTDSGQQHALTFLHH